MSVFTSTKKGLCMDQLSDLSERLFESLTQHVDPYPFGQRDVFDPIAYLRAECLTKHPSLKDSKSPDDRRNLAIAKLLVSDARCTEFNNKSIVNEEFSSFKMSGLLTTARSLIGNLLIGFERSFLDGAMFSNGASQGFKLRDAAIYKKIAGQATVTVAAYNAAVLAVKTCPHWADYMFATYGDESKWFRRVYGNGVFTVPKNNQIDRAACKEPDMNMYLQKGAGSFIRSRLRSVGIDLNDQSRNQKLAKLASIDSSLATIDLSSASDSISDRLVFELLPPDIYSFLHMIRSRFTIVNGEGHRWGLFSTMGNGFTFELESLIFWALARSVQILRGSLPLVSVYGDDIIVPVPDSEDLISVLESLNFTVNRKKTFTTGYFRESCGGHFFRGIDVKPFYIRRPITDLPTTILVANRIRGWGTVNGVSDPRLYTIWCEFRDRIPSILWGGKNLDSDCALVTGDNPRMKLVRRTRRDTGFGISDKFTSSDHHGRLVQWFHTPGCEVSQTVVLPRFSLKANSEWVTTIPLFPQE